jgi:hypothetical protein
MKWFCQRINFRYIAQRPLPSVAGIIIFILIVVVINAYGPWIPRTKILPSLKDFPLKLPANFADFPSNGICTWSILSYGRFDILWGEHTGLHDVAEWRINFYVSQGLQPQFHTDIRSAIRGIINKEDEVTKDEYYVDMMEQLENEYVMKDFGKFNPKLRGIKGIDIARVSVHERKFIMCWVNDKMFVFVFYLY